MEDTGRSIVLWVFVDGGLTGLNLIALTMMDVPKRNKKGKRVA